MSAKLRATVAALCLSACLQAPAIAATVIDFSAGDNPWQARALTRDDLLPALDGAAAYLVRSMRPDGQFIYNNDPLGRCCSKKPDRYSLIRHLGAVYALLRAQQITPSSDYLAAAKKGLDFVRTFTSPYGAHKTVVRGLADTLSLGENGFLLLDAVLYDHLAGGQTHAALAQDLQSFISENLVFDGALATKEGWAEAQAIIGLVFFHKFQAPDAAALTVAKRWLDANTRSGKPSHWSMQAVDWVRSVDPTIDQHTVDTALHGMKELVQPVTTAAEGAPTRLIGARKNLLVSCSATARNEGLLAAAATARATGNLNQARYFWARAKEHLAFALQFQFGLPGNLYESDPSLVRLAKLFHLEGGVANDPHTAAVRIDYVAHHIRALATYLDSPQVPVTAGLKIEELE